MRWVAFTATNAAYATLLTVQLTRSNSLMFGALPLLCILTADAVVMGLSEGKAMPQSTRGSLILGAILIAAALAIVPNIVVRTTAAFLLFGGVIVGAASIGPLYVPALVAAIYAARFESRVRAKGVVE